MKFIDSAELKGKKVLVRVDFNVPLNESLEITDDTRIQMALPTLKYILKEGGALILMTHLGRPKDGPEEKLSLKHIIPHLSECLGVPVQFCSDCIGPDAKPMADALQPGQVLLLENLRFHKAEKKGEPEFAKALASLGEVYVDDAFGSAHRPHCSTYVITQHFPDKKYCGFLLKSEIENADKVLKHPERKYVAIMGGAKVSEKIKIIENLLEKIDSLVIGGGMSYTFLKSQGFCIGTSLCETEQIDFAQSLLKKAKDLGVKVILPVDAVIADKFAADAEHRIVTNKDFPEGWMGLDIGPESVKNIREELLDAKTILWNGPMGVFEFDAFAHGTFDVAKSVVEATEKGAFSLIGGGDSAAAIKKSGLSDKVSFISTGGGALLEYLEGVELPGVTALN